MHKFFSSSYLIRKFVLGKYHWRTFEDFASEATVVSQALRNLGLKPKDKVGILAETRAEWILTVRNSFLKNDIIFIDFLKLYFSHFFSQRLMLASKTTSLS